MMSQFNLKHSRQAIVFFLLICFCCLSSAQSLNNSNNGFFSHQINKLTPKPENRAGAGSYFGHHVAINNDFAVVGAPNVAGHGAVYVYHYHNDQWQKQAEIVPENIKETASFGRQVFLTDTFLFIASEFGYYGKVHVYTLTNNGWSQVQVLNQTSGGHLNDDYGASIASINNHLFIGTPKKNSQVGDNTGIVYAYAYNGNQWVETQVITSNDIAEKDQFGSSVSVSSQQLAIGSPHHDSTASDSGAVYIFEQIGGQWQQQQKIISSDNGHTDYFGFSVSLENNLLVVGAPYGSSDANGSAYVFNYNGTSWVESKQLFGSVTNNLSLFGWSVTLNNNRVVIGAMGDDTALNNAGAAYIFEFDGGDWTLQKQLFADEPKANEEYGVSVAVFEDNVMVGAPEDETVGDNAGATYMYSSNMGQWDAKQKITTGESASFDEFGSQVLLENQHLIISSPRDKHEQGIGLITLFNKENGQWVESQTIPNLGLGYMPMAISDERALLGLSGDDDLRFYTYLHNTWQESQLLTVNDANKSNSFGRLASMSGNKAVINDTGQEYNQTPSGAVYAFEFDGIQWAQNQKLTPPEITWNQLFGHQVLLKNDQLFISAVKKDEGVVYVYEHDGISWQLVQTISPPSTSITRFGNTLTVNQNVMVVTTGANPGTVYIYNYDGLEWVYSQTLSSIQNGEPLEVSLNIDNNYLLVGDETYRTSSSSYQRGGVYVFRFNQQDQEWQYDSMVLAQDGLKDDYFGDTVKSDGDTFVVSAPRDDDSGYNSGSVYVFTTQDLIFEDGFDQ